MEFVFSIFVVFLLFVVGCVAGEIIKVNFRRGLVQWLVSEGSKTVNATDSFGNKCHTSGNFVWDVVKLGET